MSFDQDLMVVIPTGELGYNAYWQHQIDRDSYLHKDFGQLVQKGNVLNNSRGHSHQNLYELTQRALAIPGWKRLLVMEHDHGFPPEVYRKHAAYTQPVVGALYVVRDYREPLPVIFHWDTQRQNAQMYDAVDLKRMIFEQPGLHEVDCVPFGCCSIRRDVLETWPKDRPMFSVYSNPSGKGITHDIWFCRLAQDQGWSIWVDTSLQVEHFGLIPLSVQFFGRWWDEIGSKQAVQAHQLEVVDGTA